MTRAIQDRGGGEVEIAGNSGQVARCRHVFVPVSGCG